MNWKSAASSARTREPSRATFSLTWTAAAPTEIRRRGVTKAHPPDRRTPIQRAPSTASITCSGLARNSTVRPWLIATTRFNSCAPWGGPKTKEKGTGYPSAAMVLGPSCPTSLTFLAVFVGGAHKGHFPPQRNNRSSHTTVMQPFVRRTLTSVLTRLSCSTSAPTTAASSMLTPFRS